MIIDDGEGVKVEKSPIITYQRRKRGSRKYIPEEIWVEIFSRLPIKSLFTSRCVCKPWGNSFFTLENKINSDPLYVPVCGLFLLSRREDDCSFAYFCMTTKKTFSWRNLTEHNLIYPSGFQRGLLSDLTLDFSILRRFIEIPDPCFVSYYFNGGLILGRFADGTSKVYNPATKQLYFVPQPPTVENIGLGYRSNEENPMVVIPVPSHLNEQRCHFIIVRLCTTMRIMEVYHGVTCRWRKYRLKLDYELLSSLRWAVQNFAAFIEGGELSIFALTDNSCGIAIKFEGALFSKTKQYCFPLPEVVLQGILFDARLWECDKSLYLIYFNDTELWVWKAGSTQHDAWAWVTILEISNTTELCKPVGRELLSKAVRNKNDLAMAVAMHPNVAVVYLLVKSSMYAYNLNTDTVEMIADIREYDHGRTYYGIPYQPCLRFMSPRQ